MRRHPAGRIAAGGFAAGRFPPGGHPSSPSVIRNGQNGRVHADWAHRGPDLIADGEINAPMVDQALAWLAGRVPDARRVLDVGSGPGVAACTLAELLPGAEVLAVDGAPELLELAEARAADRGLADRVAVRHTTLPDGLRELPPAAGVGVAPHLDVDGLDRIAVFIENVPCDHTLRRELQLDPRSVFLRYDFDHFSLPTRRT